MAFFFFNLNGRPKEDFKQWKLYTANYCQYFFYSCTLPVGLLIPTAQQRSPLVALGHVSILLFSRQRSCIVCVPRIQLRPAADLWDVSEVQFGAAWSVVFARSILQVLWSVSWQVSVGLTPCTEIANSMSTKNTHKLLQVHLSIMPLFLINGMSLYFRLLCLF